MQDLYHLLKTFSSIPSESILPVLKENISLILRVHKGLSEMEGKDNVASGFVSSSLKMWIRSLNGKMFGGNVHVRHLFQDWKRKAKVEVMVCEFLLLCHSVYVLHTA